MGMYGLAPKSAYHCVSNLFESVCEASTWKRLSIVQVGKPITSSHEGLQER
jgi:hypothetical protein